MTRLCVLYTGGTIGMDHTPDGLAPVPGLLPRLMQRLRDAGHDFDLIEYEELIDSSAITIAHWNRIVADIADRYDAYDGFVVIHGTDTMAYTASVLAFALKNLSKPVVLTGSQLPLVHPRSDGWSNLADAFEAASQKDLVELAIAFDRLLLRGCRARKVGAASFSGFDSPNAPHLATFGIAARWHREHWRAKPAGEFAAQTLDESARVVALFLTPGEGAAIFGKRLAEGDLAGAILMSYGNGNAPDEPALIEGVKKATEAGTLVLNLTQVFRGAVKVGAYAASQPLARAGALPGADLTPEAALAKLTVLASQSGTAEEKRARLMEDWAGEWTV
ncbi:asparaginase [Crenobacter cavernae]|uniref:Asparaginase n=1 Tax=Crenobacter cavernae TaxID=2290923 RepID=A0ABY0FJ60_9NEIS|nr:asparaginase [Crenobacter cavernae]RXZ45607.1 asparaginase [Crenobacter cavernae]